MKVKQIQLDREAGSAYLYFEEIRPGEAVHQLVFPGGVIFDLSKDGRILGIEIMNPDITRNLTSRKIGRQLEELHIPLRISG